VSCVRRKYQIRTHLLAALQLDYYGLFKYNNMADQEVIMYTIFNMIVQKQIIVLFMCEICANIVLL